MARPATFAPLTDHDGYPPLEDLGLIGDGATAALVGRDVAVVWLCAPRFDSPPLFCRLLDARRGGALTVAPDRVVEARQGYAGDTGVLVTELRGPDGLVRVTDALTLRAEWREPDHGIWEVRTPGRVFTYSAALCQVALDRPARVAECLGLPGDVAGWRADADAIRAAILEEAWDPARHSLTEHLGGGGLDASLLALPLRRVLPADHPRMVATVEAVVKTLGAGNGLLYRYLPDESPDGLPGHEGAFLLCSFWLADNLALQGRLTDAHDLFDSLCAQAGPLGLLPEEIDPASGAFLGNYPQAFSHVGLISTGVTLARLAEGQRP